MGPVAMAAAPPPVENLPIPSAAFLEEQAEGVGTPVEGADVAAGVYLECYNYTLAYSSLAGEIRLRNTTNGQRTAVIRRGDNGSPETYVIPPNSYVSVAYLTNSMCNHRIRLISST